MLDHVSTMLLPGPCAGAGMLLVQRRTRQYVRVLRRVSTQIIVGSINPRDTAAQSTDARDAAMQARIPCTSRPATGNVESTQADYQAGQTARNTLISLRLAALDITCTYWGHQHAHTMRAMPVSAPRYGGTKKRDVLSQSRLQLVFSTVLASSSPPVD